MRQKMGLTCFHGKTKGGEKTHGLGPAKEGRGDRRGGAGDEKEETVNKGGMTGGGMGWADET